MKLLKRSEASSYKPFGLIAISMAVVLAAGCASAEQRLESKQQYREAQVRSIEIQAEQATARQTSEALAKAEMWKSLSKAIASNPESASHFAIVMAVAAARSNPEGSESIDTPVMRIHEERSTTALDVVKAVTPAVMGSLTQVGVAAIAAETLRNASDNSRQVRIAETEQDGKLWDVLSDAVNGGDATDVTDATDSTDTTPADDTTPVDDTAPVEDVVDPSEDVVDPSEDETPTEEPAVDCSAPMFSPMPPECS